MSRSDTMVDCQRADERFRLETATWNHGRVVNLSSSGACLLDERTMSPVRGGESMNIEISSGNAKLTLPVEVRWARHSSAAGGRLIGVQFPPMSEAYRKAVETLARFGFVEPMACAERAAEACSPEVEAEPVKKSNPKVTADRPARMIDLYMVLSVRTDANEDDIKSAFRREAARWHPDTCSSPDAAERFMEVSKAYRVLRDPQARERYDSLLRSANAKPSQTPTVEPSKSDRRDKGRLRCEELHCNLGLIVNASSDGLQVMSKRFFGLRKGKTMEVHLHDGVDKLTIKAQIAWMFKAGHARRVGLQLYFEDNAQQEAYWQMVRNDSNVTSSTMRDAA